MTEQSEVGNSTPKQKKKYPEDVREVANAVKRAFLDLLDEIEKRDDTKAAVLRKRVLRDPKRYAEAVIKLALPEEVHQEGVPVPLRKTGA